MENLDLAVIRQLNQWLANDIDCWLCTVIHTWGSSPRRPGSLLVCNEAGDVVGSLSGGCVEDDLIEQLQQRKLAQQGPVYKRYGDSQQDIEKFKLPCGGILGILIEPLLCSSTTSEHKAAVREQFQRIGMTLSKRQGISRYSNWQDNNHHTQLTSKNPELTYEADHAGNPKSIQHIYGPAIHLLIIGVCEVSRYLAEFALSTGFRVSICDPRPDMANQWLVENCNVYTTMPDDTVRKHAADRNSAIVAVSHDPRIDDMGLMDAFSTDAFYIGAMGSAKTSAKRRERLSLLGVTDQQMQRLHAPVGIDIGSKTPAEIAISIIAEIITCQNKPDNDAPQ